jgi:hypothetical protein
MNGTITIDVAIAILVFSQVAQWAGIYLNNRNAKRALVMRIREDEEKARIPICSAAAELVKEHIGVLATHTAQIASNEAAVLAIRAEYGEAVRRIESKLDQLILNLHSNRGIGLMEKAVAGK